MRIRKSLIVAAAASCVATSAYGATVSLNSFENSLGGYVYPAGGDTLFTISGYSTTTGVTDGSYSAIFSPSGSNTGSGPNYTQFIESPGYSTSLLSTLSNASAVTLDVFAPTGSFNGYIQFQAAIQTNDAPAYTYTEIGGFDAAHTPTFGTESTIQFTIPTTLQTTLKADVLAGYGAQFSISIGGGYTTGNETAYLDNLVAVVPNAVPEPASLGLLALAAPALVRRRRA